MFYIGIDPGKKGGVSILFNNRLVISIEIPIGADKNIDIVALSTLIKNVTGERDLYGITCFIEKAQPMPKQGVVSVFNYGKGYGELTGMLKLLSIPFQEIQPQKWKKEYALIKKGKEQSVITAQQLFPQENFYTERGRMKDGKAESLLIAEFVRRKFNG